MGGKGSGGTPGNKSAKRVQDAQCPKAPDAKTNAAILSFCNELLFLDVLPDLQPASVADRLAVYLDTCSRHGMRPQLNGLALALGMTRQTVYDIAHGKQATHNGREIPAETVVLLKKFYVYLATVLEANLGEGKGNPVAGIFIAKNHFGYVSEVVHTTQPAQTQPQLTAAVDVANRYTITAGRAETAQLTPAQD